MYEYVKNKLQGSSYARNVLILMSGSVIAQVVPLLIAPILTRLYTPEEFGVYALYLSISGILASFATARYEVAIMLPQNESSASSIVLLSMMIAFLVSSVLFVLIYIFNDRLATENMPAYYMYYIPITVMMMGFHESMRVWYNRKKEYKRIAINRVEQSLSGGGGQLAFGVTQLGSFGLILGQLFGQIYVVVRFAWHARKEEFFRPSKTSLLKAYGNAKRYASFLKYGALALMGNRAAQESLIVLVGYFLTAGIAGYISLLSRIVGIPSSVLGRNLGEVFYQSISEVKKEESYPLVIAFMKKLLMISLPIYLALYYVIDISLVFIFGDQWSGALFYAPYIVFIAALYFIFTPLLNLFHYYEIQSWNLVWNLIWLCTNILVFVVYSLTEMEMRDLFQLYSASQLIVHIIGMIFLVNYSRSMQSNND